MTSEAIPRAWIEGEPSPVPARGVHELFLMRASHSPDALAIRQWDIRLTYRQFAAATTDLARRLVAAGVRRGSRVGVCSRRVPQLPASEMAVLMAGGTFVPLDLGHPAERLRVMVADAGIETALVDEAGAELLTGIVSQLIETGPLRTDARMAGPDEFGPAAMDQAAYVMYTSGSTGRPKGVMVSHRNLAAFVSAISQDLNDTPGHRVAAFAAAGFDVAIYEFFGTLAGGGSLHLVSEAERGDAGLLQRFLEAHRVTRVFLPPVLLPLLDPGRLPGLRELMVGGEPCDPGQVDRWAVPGQRKFLNWYGPTETTVVVVSAELSGAWDRPLPIGRPLPGCSAYVLDEQMTMCPPGQAGELFIGGAQVSLGYVSATAQDAARFVPDPFDQAGTGPAGRLYRTGDLAHWDDTGTIWYLGRADRQVQVHGHRVEPGEIEMVLRGHPQVTQAAVDVYGATIRAYVTPLTAPSSEELRGYCSAWLPRHMIPVGVTRLERLPMTVNAKVDFAALRHAAQVPAGEASAGETPAAGSPDSGFSQVVARCWAELFGTGPEASEDDFFLAGGDSLSAMRLASALRHGTGREITAEDVFAGRTISGIAARLSSAVAAEGSVLPTGSPAALSSAQRRLWFVEQFAPGVPVHNIVMAEQINGVLDVPTLEHAFGHVLARQAALRWRLRPADGLPEVDVTEPTRVSIPVTDLRPTAAGHPTDAGHSTLARLLDEQARTPIDLTSGPLYRIRLLRTNEAEHVLVITVHHIVFDGWSQDILYRELGEAYNRQLADGRTAARTGADYGFGEAGDAQEPPTSTPVTFADYTTWVLDQAERRGPSDTGWWERHLAGAPLILDLPRDHPRPAVLSFQGEARGTPIGARLSAAVSQLATTEGTTPGTVLLAAFNVLLWRLTGQRDQVVGTPVADREQPGLEHLIGFFVRTLPLRLRVDEDITFAEHIRRCGEEITAARRHADAPLERIVEMLGGARELTRNPLFQVMFNVYNFTEPRLGLSGTVTRRLHAVIPGSLVDLTLYVIVEGGGIRLEAAYNPQLYTTARVDALLDSYLCLLHDLVSDPGKSLAAANARPGQTGLPGWTAPLRSEVPDSPGLLEQIRATARGTPHAVAVSEAGRTITYGEVIHLCDATSAALRGLGVQPGDRVAVIGRRTATLPGVLLGVLSAGGKWAILDGDLPAKVLRRQLTAVRPQALIREGDSAADELTGTALPVLDTASLAASAAGPFRAASGSDVAARNRGYLSFTSGTTGEPQLIDTGEAPLVHFLNWYRGVFALGRDDRFAMLSGVAHDPLLRDMFAPLTCGGIVVVPDAGLRGDPAGLLSWLDAREITVAHMTPQLVRLMAARADGSHKVQSLRLVALSGDQFTESDVTVLRRFAPQARLVNFYGTTETPQAQAWHEISVAEPAPGSLGSATLGTMPAPVGVGIDGVQLVVMSVCGRPATVGELGEVVIRSRHLSNGYVGPSPHHERFAALPGAGEGRCYRTGDLGRYGPRGDVTLAGRMDDQVKVRGFRVELGDVEAALSSHPNVGQAAVRLFELNGASFLHAYVVAAPATTKSGVLQHARSMLPAYAVPSGVTLLPSLPLTASGKIDRAALPPPGREGPAGTATDEAPEGQAERLVLATWREVLGRPRFAATDNFFEVGGHSMAIVEVQSRLERLLGRQIPVVDLFRFPTIRSLAQHLASSETNGDLLDADMRGRLRRQRARRPRTHGHKGDTQS
jgi:amino acid adenylation domain-containing protein